MEIPLYFLYDMKHRTSVNKYCSLRPQIKPKSQNEEPKYYST